MTLSSDIVSPIDSLGRLASTAIARNPPTDLKMITKIPYATPMEILHSTHHSAATDNRRSSSNNNDPSCHECDDLLGADIGFDHIAHEDSPMTDLDVPTTTTTTASKTDFEEHPQLPSCSTKSNNNLLHNNAHHRNNNNMNSSSSVSPSELSLPLPASQSLFDAFKEQSDAKDEAMNPDILNLFMNGQRFPVEHLNLEGMISLSDRRLVKLLRAQSRHLQSLNLNGCEGLSHRLSGQLRSFKLHRLHTLQLGHTVQILGSWFEETATCDDAMEAISVMTERGFQKLEKTVGFTEQLGMTREEEAADSSASSDNEQDERGETSSGKRKESSMESKAVTKEASAAGTSSSSFSSPSKASGQGGAKDDEEAEEEAEEEEEAIEVDDDEEEMEEAAATSSSTFSADNNKHNEKRDAGGSLPPPTSSGQQNGVDNDGEEDLIEDEEMNPGERVPTPRPTACYYRLHRDLGQEPGMVRPITATTPNLRALSVYGFALEDSDGFQDSVPNVLRNLLTPLNKLECLDISYWEGVEDCRFLRPVAPILNTLILYNVPDLYLALDTICELKMLTKLDVSQGGKDTGIYPRPVNALNKLVTALRHLKHLDLSSTNLPYPPSRDDYIVSNEMLLKSDIYGLRNLRKPLEFLGLFNCDHSARLPNVPSQNVTGDANEGQVLLSLESYIDRQDLLREVLNEVYSVYRWGGQDAREAKDHSRALHLVLDAMRRYISDSSTQIAGSASLFYIIKNVDMTFATKRKVVKALLNGMEEHIEEQVMVRNCCLSLCQVSIPADVLFDYQRAARLLTAAINHHGVDDMTQKVAVYLLNLMACHVEGDQKIQVGYIGAIEAILKQITRRVISNICDEVMEVAWSFLWNITDETPQNCAIFIRNEGLETFVKCYYMFDDRKELVRNMMGLMGNIAEVSAYRTIIAEEEYIRIFVALLQNMSEGIEISYNSAGVLANICADGPEKWKSENPSQDEVMDKMVEAIKCWKVDERRFINYRSFGPILRLLHNKQSHGSLHWATWALANLTTVDGDKYCGFVANEGGIPLLRSIFSSADIVNKDVRALTRTILANIVKWIENRKDMGMKIDERKYPGLEQPLQDLLSSHTDDGEQ